MSAFPQLFSQNTPNTLSEACSKCSTPAEEVHLWPLCQLNLVLLLEKNPTLLKLLVITPQAQSSNTPCLLGAVKSCITFITQTHHLPLISPICMLISCTITVCITPHSLVFVVPLLPCIVLYLPSHPGSMKKNLLTLLVLFFKSFHSSLTTGF